MITALVVDSNPAYLKLTIGSFFPKMMSADGLKNDDASAHCSSVLLLVLSAELSRPYPTACSRFLGFLWAVFLDLFAKLVAQAKVCVVEAQHLRKRLSLMSNLAYEE